MECTDERLWEVWRAEHIRMQRVRTPLRRLVAAVPVEYPKVGVSEAVAVAIVALVKLARDAVLLSVAWSLALGEGPAEAELRRTARAVTSERCANVAARDRRRLHHRSAAHVLWRVDRRRAGRGLHALVGRHGEVRVQLLLTRTLQLRVSIQRSARC